MKPSKGRNFRNFRNIQILRTLKVIYWLISIQHAAQYGYNNTE